jgi:hypothetical protein
MSSSDAEQDDIRRDLEAMLAAAAPSPAFHVRVRQRIAEEAVRPRWSKASVWTAAAAACVLAIGVGMALPRRAVTRNRPTASLPVLARATSPPSSSQSDAIREAPRSAGFARGRAAHERRASPGRLDEVMVPPGEQLALIYLLQGLKEHRVSVPPPLGPNVDADGLLLPPDPVTIVPLPDLVAPAAVTSGGKADSGPAGGQRQ